MIAFTNLTATINGSSAVSNAFITFTVNGYPLITATNSSMFNIAAPPVSFTPGNLAVLQIDTLNNNTTFSIIEVKPSAAGQTAPVNVVPISATGTNALRQSSAGSTGRLALSDDGTLLGFAAFADDSAATPDEAYNLNRVAASLNYSGQLSIGLNYTSISLGGSQARAACVLDDDQNWIADDKGGLYEGSLGGGAIASPNLNAYNNVVVKTFGGTPYIETQKAVNGLSIPVVYALGFDPDTGLYDVTFANNLATDANASDFYLVSTNGGSTYDILYVNDQNSATQGVIKKYSLVSGNWTANGSFTNSTGVDGLLAHHQRQRRRLSVLHDGQRGHRRQQHRPCDGRRRLESINGHYLQQTSLKASSKTSIKGLTFTPRQTAHAAGLIPPPSSPPKMELRSSVRSASRTLRTILFGVPPSPASRWTVSRCRPPPMTRLNRARSFLTRVNPRCCKAREPNPSSLVPRVMATTRSFRPLSCVPSSILEQSCLAEAQLTFAFTNATGLSFSVLATNNIRRANNQLAGGGTGG